MCWSCARCCSVDVVAMKMTVSMTLVVLTHILSPWSRVILEHLTGYQPVKKFPAFYGNRGFIIALTSARDGGDIVITTNYCSPY